MPEEVIVHLGEPDKRLLDNISRQVNLLTKEISRLCDAVEASVDEEPDG